MQGLSGKETTVAEGLGAAVELAGVVKRFHTGGADIVAVDDLSMTFEPGTMTAITGPSGSGKSTLLHLIGAVERADSGSITIDGVELTGLRRAGLTGYRRTVGFVFQRYHLLPTLTALDNVVAPVLPYRVRYNKSNRATELLAAVGMAGRERSLPAELSGGQQQRVAIARALMGRPRLLLADEPTGNLDSKTGTDVLDLLLRLRDEYSMTVLIATHEHHIAARCDRLVRLRDGHTVEDVNLTGGHDSQSTLDRISGLRL
jgi:putative ABC transport system ATP-binding protein